MPPIRIAYVVNDLAFLLSHRKRLVEGARHAGYEVHVVAPDGPAAPEVAALGVQLHRWRLARTGEQPADELRSVAELVWIYRTLSPQLVHHVTVKPVLYGSLAARLTRVPAVVNAVSGLGFAFLADGLRARFRRLGITMGYRAALSLPRSRVILQNDDDERDLLEANAVSPSHIVKIRGSGVDLERFVPTPLPPSPVLVVLPARVLRDKGVEEFVEAARRIKRIRAGVRLALVGGLDLVNPAGIPQPAIERWVNEGVVEWWGHRADMPQVYAQAHVVCLPSYREGMPKALLEAAAAGRAIVTTDVPGCRDAVGRGTIGVLVPVRDPSALTVALLRLIDDEHERSRLGSEAARYARANFDEKRVVEAHLAVYRELLSGTPFGVPGGVE